MPVTKGVGSEVLMGTVNKEGMLHIRYEGKLLCFITVSLSLDLL